MITQDSLKELLSYDPETGVFVWRVSKGAAKAGSEAGGVNDRGYIQIRINRKPYFAHRLAWLYVHGYFPEHDIDHVNGIKTDNRLSNLRESSRQCNMQNQCMKSNNTSGIPGVCWHKAAKKWQAKIQISGKRIHLGFHETKKAAAAARYQFEQDCQDWHCDARNSTLKAIEREFGGEFAQSLGGTGYEVDKKD